MKNLLHFTDHLIPYDTFLNDIASRVVRLLKSDADDPEFVSQRKACAILILVDCFGCYP